MGQPMTHLLTGEFMRILVGVVTGWLAFSASAAAQNTTSWEGVEDIVNTQRNQLVRAETTDGRRATGTIADLNATTIAIINEYGDVARFARADVQRIEKKFGSTGGRARGVKKGLMWGALVSALLSIGPMTQPEGPAILPYLWGSAMGSGAAIGALSASDPSADWVVVYSAF